MSAAGLLADLHAAGITIIRHGDNLRVRGALGVELAPHLAAVKAHKPALLAELLKGEIVAALYTDPRDFDRDGYLALVALWRANTDEEIN
jgi:hypothetical protein